MPSAVAGGAATRSHDTVPSTTRDRRCVAVHLLAVLGLALSGCAAPQPAADRRTEIPAAATRDGVPASGVASSVAPLPPAAATAVAAPPVSRAAAAPPRNDRKPTKTRSGSTGRCGSSLSQAWASWPMPNPKGAGLPNRASYTDLGNGSVRDNVTCLVWQKGYSPGRHTWAAAKAYCAGLTIGGTGWRLPSRVELTSIMDFTRSGPAIDTAVFHGLSNFFWTGSPWAVRHDPPYAWLMNFFEGLTSNAGNTANAHYVRCVRGATGSGGATYAKVAPGEVKDVHTGLIWQQASSPQTMSAARAASYCAGLDLNGHAWRLPSIKELATTVDEARVAPAIRRSVFPDTAKATYYWSSSASRPEPGKTWGLNYDDGFTNYRKITAGYVRCVR